MSPSIADQQEMQFYFDSCDHSLMNELKRTIQDSVSEMIDGSSVLIRLMYFLSKNNDDSAKKFQDLLHNGKLFAWISTF
jgi:hypothetical protein